MLGVDLSWFCYLYGVLSLLSFPGVLPSFGRQSGMSQPGGMVGAVGSQEGLVTEADIWQTMLRKGLVSRMCIPWEMSLSLGQAVA